MPLFSRASLQKLFTCDKRLQNLMQAVIKKTDIIILCGHRGEKAQEEAVAAGTSQTHYPNSKHNSDPSMAVDIAPYYAESPHIRWQNIDEFVELSKIVKQTAEELGIDIQWGGDWPNFKDFPHYQVDPIED